MSFSVLLVKTIDTMKMGQATTLVLLFFHPLSPEPEMAGNRVRMRMRSKCWIADCGSMDTERGVCDVVYRASPADKHKERQEEAKAKRVS